MKSILDPSFHYRPSFATDVRQTFKRIHCENEAASDAIRATSAEQSISDFASPSRFPAAQRRQPAHFGPGPVAIIVASLFAAALFFQPPARSNGTTLAGLAAEKSAVVHSSDRANKIAELERQFWVCDYIGTTRGIDGPHAVTCGANYEELKRTKFGGDFEKLVTWWRLNKIAVADWM